MKPTLRNHTATFLGALALVVFAATPAAAQKVTIGHGGPLIDITHPGLYISNALGYAKGEGIDLTVQTTQGSQQALQLLAAGQVDFIQVVPETIINAQDQGVAAKIVYSNATKYSSEIAFLAGGPIKEVKDLKGKQVGVLSMASGGVPFLKAVVREAGLDPDKDIVMVPTGAGAPAAAALSSGQVTALSLWAGAFAIMENSGYKLVRVGSKSLYHAPGHVLATTDDYIKKNPAIVAKMGRIYAKSTVFAMTNPSAAVQAYWKHLPQNKPADANEKTLADSTNIIKVGLSFMTVDDRTDKRWGWNDAVGVDKLQDYLIANGARTTKVPMDKLITNELVDEYNKFDPAPIMAAARDYKS